MRFNVLPAALAQTTVLEVLDLSYSSVLGGTLPTEFSSWLNLTVFK